MGGRPSAVPDLAESTIGKTVLLFGVSGVGKSTAAEKLTRLLPELLHFQASTLLREALATSGENLRTAKPRKIAENQNALANALTDARRPHPKRPVLVDAHSVIDNDEALIPLPLESFAALQPSIIAFLKAAPADIQRQRLTDSRERPKRTIAQIAAYQEFALEVARRLAIYRSRITKLAAIGRSY